MVVVNIKIELIKDDFDLYYGRNEKSKKIVENLMKDIAENGLKNPLVVYFDRGIYEIIDGSHRIRALKNLSWKEIPCEIVNHGRQSRPNPSPTGRS